MNSLGMWQVLPSLWLNSNSMIKIVMKLKIIKRNVLFRSREPLKRFVIWKMGCPVAQAVRHSPPIAGVRSSLLGDTMWVSWWTKRCLDRFISGFLPFSHPKISFYRFTILISFISFHFISSALLMVRQAWSAGIHALCRTRVEICLVSKNKLFTIYLSLFEFFRILTPIC